MRSTRAPARWSFLLLVLAAGATLGIRAPLEAQEPFSIQDVLSPPFPVELVSARSGDRIAWIAYQEGVRNVYTASAPDFAPRLLTHNSADDGVDLSSLHISGDGSLVTFIRGHTPNHQGWIANPSSDPRGGERAVWAVNTSGGEPWRVAEAWDQSLSPDGRWIAWGKDGQIWRAPVDPGTAEVRGAPQEGPLFRAWGDNDDPVWSPDGRRIAFVTDREDHSFIGVYDTQARQVSYMAPGVDRDNAPVWSLDGRQLAFVRRPGLPFGAEADHGDARPEDLPPGVLEARFEDGSPLAIWVADAATGEGRELWRAPPGDSAWAEVRELLWGEGHVLFQAEPDGWRRVYSLAVDSPHPQPVMLTPGEGEVEHLALSADGRTLDYTTNAGDIDRRHLWRVAVEGGRPRQLTRGATIETYPAPLASGEAVAVLHSSARRPLSVALVPGSGGEPRLVSPEPPPQFPAARHVEPTAVTLTAEDGFESYAQLFLPPDLKPGERRPALLFVHGGSRRQMLLGYHYMLFYHMAYAMNQYFANKGYVVMSVNYRSGIGYGRDFRNAPGRGGRGNTEYRDVLAAGRYLQGRADVDPARVGVWGLSYGGILTAQALARNSDVFAAGVDMAGVHLWGNSLDPGDVSYQSSSISQVSTWRSPVLLIQGDDDRNVDFSQTVGLVQALRANEVPYELIVFPDEVHDFLVHGRWLEAFSATDDFFRRRLVEKRAVEEGGK